MIGVEPYSSRAIDIRDRLARHLCDEAGQHYWHLSTRSRWQGEAQSLIDRWKREPVEPASDIDRLCQEALENDRAAAQARAERADYRNGLREAQEAISAPDPTTAVLNVRDALSGQIWAITLPSGSVARELTSRISGT